MKPSELRDKDAQELVKLESELREKLIRMRIAQAASKAVNSAQIGQIRADIARIKTIQTERQRGSASTGDRA